MKILASSLATCFGLGRARFAPGTLGSIVGAILSIPIATDHILFLLILLKMTALAFWSSIAYSRNTGKKDPSEVIVDEIVGQMLSLYIMMVWLNINTWCLRTALLFVVNVACFRLFDIVKPYPISLIDDKADWRPGIVLDDLLAGLFAAFTVILLVLIIDGAILNFRLPFVHL